MTETKEKKEIKYECRYCGTMFIKDWSKGQRRYCSVDCRVKYNRYKTRYGDVKRFSRTMSTRIKGLKFEKIAKDVLEKRGFFVMLSRNSRTPFDLAAIKGTELWLVSCKVWLGSEPKKLSKYAKKFMLDNPIVRVFVCHPKNGSIKLIEIKNDEAINK